jgi:hypothetical protein
VKKLKNKLPHETYCTFLFVKRSVEKRNVGSTAFTIKKRTLAKSKNRGMANIKIDLKEMKQQIENRSYQTIHSVYELYHQCFNIIVHGIWLKSWPL